MSKLAKKSDLLFKNGNSEFVEGFEHLEISQNSPNFRQEFISSPLQQQEAESLQKILLEKLHPEREASVIPGDYRILLILTQQIRAIDRQSVLLHGERIQRAQEVLKKYKDGAFTNWLNMTYGNRQTPYRMLRFYELFQKIETPDRLLLESMPKKAAYSLAMREGDIQKKMDIIREYHKEEQNHILHAIQKILPLSQEDRRTHRKIRNDTLLNSLEETIVLLNSRHQDWDHGTINRLRTIRDELSRLLGD